MGKILKKSFMWCMEKVGYDRLNSSFRKYLCVFMCFMVASLLSVAYFNVFLLKVIGDADAVAGYNLLLACIQPIVMIMALPVLRCTSVNTCQRIGLALHAVAYLYLAVCSNVSVAMVYVISCTFSAGNAFYYTSYTPQLLAYTEDESRDVAFGSMGFISTIGNLTIPLIAGFFITAFGDVIGYRVLFAVSSLALMAGIFFSFRLAKVEVEKRIEKKVLGRVFRRMLTNRDMLVMLIITMLTAAEVSGKAYYSSVLVYELLKKESVIGTVTTVGAVITLGANLLYGRFVMSKNRGKSMLWGSIITLAATLFLNMYKTALGYIIYFSVYSLAAIFIANPVVTEYMGVLQKDEFLSNHGAEVHACREFFYAAGRALGLIPAFFIPASVKTSSALLILIVALQLFSAVMMVFIQKRRCSEISGVK